jgi:broad specificity phosphatase PhoE
MKIILLRHEERFNDPGFYTKLTDNGIINSLLLPSKLYDYNIDFIFCSPFIRTLETIESFCYKYNKKVNLEYGLYEYIHNPYFLLNKWYYDINEIDSKFNSIIDFNYKSIINKNDFSVLENEKDLEHRIIKFFDYLLSKYRNNTILIVSHMGTINKIKDLYFKKTKLNDLFSMGHYEIYELS